jgi:hypothetical protein
MIFAGQYVVSAALVFARHSSPMAAEFISKSESPDKSEKFVSVAVSSSTRPPLRDEGAEDERENFDDPVRRDVRG